VNSLNLAKQDLDPGWIEAAIGEPYLIKDNLFNIVEPPHLNVSKNIFEYSKPQGYEPLVKFLEDKYQAPVVITSGAKQALGALFYAIKKTGIKDIFMRTPYWSLFPPLIEMHGLRHGKNSNIPSAYLAVLPNNPDGKDYLSGYVNHDYYKCIIHDAAYYSPIYMKDFKFQKIGDVQVFTCSKMFGLSQLRLGYAVFHDMDLYNSVLEYMETMTVGISVLAQVYALELLQHFKNNPESLSQFENKCYNELINNRKIINQIDSNICTIDPHQMGMFLWAKYNNFSNFEKAKVKVVEGTPFGMPGYFRMNLAFDSFKILEIVERLNGNNV